MADDSATSVTRVNENFDKIVGGRMINVVDTPGCMDTEKGKKILDEIAAAVTEHPEGYDAVLIVLKYVPGFVVLLFDKMALFFHFYGSQA